MRAIIPGASTLGSGLRAFRSRNYRLYFGGQGISLIGTWMQFVAMSWLVWRLTSSPLILGLVGFSSQIPFFILTPFAGALVDRWERRRILLVTQSLAMAQALLLALLVFSGAVEIWHVVALSLVLGTINSMDLPTRQAFVVDIVEERTDFGNAIALNSAMFNGARLVGPSAAGVVVAAAGEGVCFLINGVTYLSVIVALFAMTPRVEEIVRARPKVWHGVKEGLRYSYKSPAIRAILLLVGFLGLVGSPYLVLVPVVADEVLGGGPNTLGFLMGAAGVGALIGAAVLASREGTSQLTRAIPLATGVFAVGLVGFSQSTTIPASLAFMVVLGFGLMVQMVSCNMIIQTLVEDDKRGRVMSLYVTAFLGIAPFGNLLAGSVADAMGTPTALLILGICCGLAAAIFARVFGARDA